VILTTPKDQELAQMSQWFADEKNLRIWSGPKFRYPFDQTTFKADLSMERLPSFCLKHSEPATDVERNFLVGFGQYYLRAERCHLGRLVINPNCRGQNKIADLISLLADKGCVDLKVNELSLFVFNDNHEAKSAYEKLGFVEAEYPQVFVSETVPMEGCVYMIKKYVV
jgi:ribosomal protein S18 acetylase RimI-like enzyme